MSEALSGDAYHPTAKRNERSTGEHWFSVFTLILYTGAVFGLLDGLYSETGRGTTGAGLLRVLLLSTYVFSAYVTIRDRAYVPSGLRRDPWISLVVGLALASTLWSSLPGQTLVRASDLLLTTWFGAYLARSYSVDDQLRLFAQALLIVLVLSLCIGALIPSAGVMHGGEFEGAWRGAFIHKNYLGRIAFLGSVVFGIAIATGRQWRYLARFGFGAALLCLALSASRTAWVSVAVVVFLLPVIRAAKHRGLALLLYGVIALILVGGGSIWLYNHLEDVMELLGRNLTLTGRTAVWFAVMTFIARRPFLGYGYSAFWQGMSGDSGYISLALHWDVPHAHNGLLELGLDTGLIGISLFLLSFVAACRQALRFYRSSDSAVGIWPILAIVFVVLANVAESSLVRYNNMFWVLYVMIVLSTQRRPIVEGVQP